MAPSVLLTVCVTYLPPKAAMFTPEDLTAAIAILREDLTSLGMPHPKAYTIKILSRGVVRFCWETGVRSLLHVQLVKRITKMSQEELSKRTISKMTLKQEPNKKLDPPPPPKMTYLHPHHVPDSALSPQGFIPHSKPIPERNLDERLGSSSQTYLSNSTPWSDTPYLQYTEPVPTSFETISSYPYQLEPPSRPQSPVLRVKEEDTSVVIGKRISRSVSPLPSAKRSRRSPLDDDKCSLLHELGSLREEIKYLVARQTRIREKLKDMGAQSVPEPDFLFRDEVRDLELEIETERKQRIEYETVLKDIRRECRVPFIVPALFDAFIDISKLTTAAMDSPR
ncbi:hypothetical protein EV421DRAFT_1816480 [Armillaria borealis]|uniref:Uncharacterized protein n=1 Tax=Armillaria borealis TaxID=47425 RepID=A0AA39JEG4_9AGAR|nr:hypothetical protein EV421DRAFT_1816480 [Armillaria borealis]